MPSLAGQGLLQDPADRLARGKGLSSVGPLRQLARCILPERNSQVPNFVLVWGSSEFARFSWIFAVILCEKKSVRVVGKVPEDFTTAQCKDNSRKSFSSLQPAAVCVCERVFPSQFFLSFPRGRRIVSCPVRSLPNVSRLFRESILESKIKVCSTQGNPRRKSSTSQK